MKIRHPDGSVTIRGERFEGEDIRFPQVNRVDHCQFINCTVYALSGQAFNDCYFCDCILDSVPELGGDFVKPQINDSMFDTQHQQFVFDDFELFMSGLLEP